MSVNLVNIRKVLRSVKSGDSLALFVPLEGEWLRISVEGAHRRKSEFTIKQMMILNQDRIDIPNLRFAGQCLLNSEVVQDILNALKTVGDGEAVRVSVTPTSIQLNTATKDGCAEAQVPIIND